MSTLESLWGVLNSSPILDGVQTLDTSARMARVKSVNTGAEVVFRRELWSRGLRYRVQYRTPLGRADVAFIRKKVAVFIDGCFWHGCPWHYSAPRTRRKYWRSKLTSNIERDRRQTIELEMLGWKVVRIWEHSLSSVDIESSIELVISALDGTHRPTHYWRVVAVQQHETGHEVRVIQSLRDKTNRRFVLASRATLRKPMLVDSFSSLPASCMVDSEGAVSPLLDDSLSDIIRDPNFSAAGPND